MKSIKEWWVSLDGERQDLDAVVEAFRTSSICQIEREEDAKYYLKATCLNDLSDGWIVMGKAEELVARLNGVMKAMFSDYRTIKANAPLTIYEDGTRNLCILPGSARLEIRGSRPTVSVSGRAARPLVSEPEKWLALSEADQDVRDALHYLSRPPGWFDLHKAYEVVCEAIALPAHPCTGPGRYWCLS